MPDPKTFLILGGYGNTGRRVARLLLDRTDARVVIAGRNEAKAREAAATLGDGARAGRISGRALDASDGPALTAALDGTDLLVVASSTSAHVRTVIEATIRAGVDSIDTQYSSEKVARLREMAPDIERAGRTVITDAGFHPGLPAVLVRYAATLIDRVEEARVGSVIRMDWREIETSQATREELAREFGDFSTLHFEDGTWREMSYLTGKGMIAMDFGPPFGRVSLAPMFMEELRPLPDAIKSLRATGFFVSGFGWLADLVVLPLAIAALKIAPRLALRPASGLIAWCFRRSGKPPFGTLLRLEASGRSSEGEPRRLAVTLRHVDGYDLTAIPVAACILQWLDGTIRRPGLATMGNAVDPVRLLADMEAMGLARSEEPPPDAAIPRGG